MFSDFSDRCAPRCCILRSFHKHVFSSYTERFFSGDAAGVAFRLKADSHAEACAMKLASYRASGPTVERVAACSRALPLVVS